MLWFRSVEWYDSIIAFGEFEGNGKKATMNVFWSKIQNFRLDICRNASDKK